MGQRTPLYEQHVEQGAKIVDFGGWDMPLHYGSQVDEHHAVRSGTGLFDVSHMNVVDVTGPGALDFLQYVLANDVGRLAPGKALYSCMLNEAGGVIDDLIVYRLPADRFRVVLNAATRDKDLAWLAQQQDGFDVSITPDTDCGMIAVQGPEARQTAAGVLPETAAEAALNLKPFTAAETESGLFVARTGYTGEDGLEIVAPADKLQDLWRGLVAAGAEAAGLGARDTLRLEAGMHLYGADLDESVTPLESGLAWTVALESAGRDFIGRQALEAQRDREDLRRFVGLLLEDRGVLRNHQRVVIEDSPDGEITSGGYSPTLARSIAMARVPAGDAERAQVEVRNRLLDVRVVALPFVRHGKAKIDL